MLDKEKRKCFLIGVACPFDTRILQKEQEKTEKYQDLTREIKRIWKCQEVVIIPVITGALGTVRTNFEQWIKKLNVYLNFYALQKACLLGSARILRKVQAT